MAAKSKQGTSGARRWCDVIAMGASAGGFSALMEVLRELVPEFPAIIVVQHLDPRHKSHLANLLARRTGKLVKQAEDGESLSSKTVYVGPPDEHLLVTTGKIQLAHSRLIRFSRPSIDMMFGSVAAIYGDRAIGVILSGSNRDGSDGICAIRRAGGITIAQDPVTAEFRVMPQSAIDTGCVDLVIPIEQIGSVLSKLLTEVRDAK